MCYQRIWPGLNQQPITSSHGASLSPELGLHKADRLVGKTTVGGHVIQITIPNQAWHISRAPLAVLLSGSLSTCTITLGGRHYYIYFKEEKKWSSERVSKLPKVTQSVTGEAWIQSRSVYCKPILFSHNRNPTFCKRNTGSLHVSITDHISTKKPMSFLVPDNGPHSFHR